MASFVFILVNTLNDAPAYGAKFETRRSRGDSEAEEERSVGDRP